MSLHSAPPINRTTDGPCPVCGRAEPAGGWVVVVDGVHRLVHTACRDWSGEAFPYARKLEVCLRSRARWSASSRQRTAAYVRRLEAIAARWPEGGAKAVTEAGRLVGTIRGILREDPAAERVVRRL